MIAAPSLRELETERRHLVERINQVPPTHMSRQNPEYVQLVARLAVVRTQITAVRTALTDLSFRLN